jgi:hypothetical protein
MNETECFLSALSAFAKLNADDQRQLIEDVTNGCKSPRPIQSVRRLFAEAIDGCDDEEIADALRNTED